MTSEYRGGFMAAVAYLLSSLAGIWGFIAILPGSLFDTSPVYRMFLGPESFWGLFALITALLQSFGAYRGKPTPFLIGGLGLVFFWSLGGLMFLQADWHSAAGYSYFALSAWQMYVCLAVFKSTART